MGNEVQMEHLTDLVTSAVLAKRFGVTRRTIANWRKNRRIPWVAISPRTIRYSLDAVARALSSRVVSHRGSAR
jgi:transcriptional regulator with XRE-family HTH domain